MTPQQELSEELRDYLYRTAAGRPRGRVRWVMSLEWLIEVRRVTGPSGAPLWQPLPAPVPDCLLGIPVEVRGDAGVPDLELVP